MKDIEKSKILRTRANKHIMFSYKIVLGNDHVYFLKNSSILKSSNVRMFSFAKDK